MIAGGSGRAFHTSRFVDVEQVRFLSYVPEDDLPGLYAGAMLTVIPSFDEGFGLPALEAMACGSPVLVSNRGALPEVVGAAAMIFDPGKPGDLKAALKCCLQDGDLRRSLKEKGSARAQAFTWQHSAELIWKTLNEN